MNVGVTVVVPSYNHAPFIERCLRSILKQTLAPSELIVIDDGSKDDSPHIIENVLKRCEFKCEFIARENRGLCQTLNEGLARSDNDYPYFAYLGSDDVWLPDFLERRVATLEARPRAVLGYGHAYQIDDRDRIIDCTTDWAAYVDGDVRRMLLSNLAPLSPAVLYRRSSVEHHGWNEQARLEDYELYLRLSREGEFAFDPSILAAWRQHDYNTSYNLEMMMHERLAAQQRAATELGIEANELAQFQSLSRFRSGEEFMRQGDKWQAVKLIAANLRATPSASALLKQAASVFIPHRILQRRKMRMREQAVKRYGSLTT